MATVNHYSATVEVAVDEIVSLMTIKYSDMEGISWTADRMHVGTVGGSKVYETCGHEDSGQVVWASHEEALAAAVAHFVEPVEDDVYPALDPMPTGWDAADHKALYE